MGFLRSPQFFPRRPLRPRNSLAAPLKEMDAKAGGARAAAAGGKENGCREEPGDLSLAEELLAARKRRERLRSEWERTERALQEMDTALERSMREAERRGEEQRKLDLAVRKLVLLLDPCGVLAKDSAPVQSLRERERERKVDEDRDKGIKATDKEREMEEATRVHQEETGEDGVKEETTPKINEAGGMGIN